MITEPALRLNSGTPLPEGYTARPATMDDIPAVTALCNADSRALDGRDEYDQPAFVREWTTPHFEPAQDVRVVVAPDGQIVGVEEAWNTTAPYVRPFAWGRVHPDHRERGIGTYLLAWAEARFRGQIALAPPDAQVMMQTGFYAHDQAATRLAEGYGLILTRRFWRMEIVFDGPPPAPRWPEGITLRTIAPGEDERAAYRVVRAAFQDHWGYVEAPFEEGYQRFMHHFADDYDPTLRFLAQDGERIVGVALCAPKPDDDPDIGWVATLGVLREYRQRGVALALLRHAFGEFYRRGKKGVGLGVDAANLTGATRLYEKAGMRVARTWANYGKVLREGRDLSTQAAS